MKTYGNLAVVPKTTEEGKRATRKVIRKTGLSSREKLLYITTVILFVIITTFVLSRHVELTEIHYNIQTMERSIATMETEIATLEAKVRTLSDPDRIREKAKELGMSYNEKQIKIASGEHTR